MNRNKKLKHSGRKHLPLPTGRYTVGCADVLTAAGKSGSLFRLYYPCVFRGTLERTVQWPLWLPHEKYAAGYVSYLGTKFQQSLTKLFYRLVDDLHVPTVWNALPIYCSEKFPLIILSHGIGGCRTSYSSLCTELASHGYVIASVEHRDHSACLSFYVRKAKSSDANPCKGLSLSDVNTSTLTDEYQLELEGSEDTEADKPSSLDLADVYVKEWVGYRKVADGKNYYSIKNKQVHFRVKECINCLNQMELINKGMTVENYLDPAFSLNAFKGVIDFERVALAGHSFGGATTVLGLNQDNRFKCGIVIDAWMYPIKNETEMLSSVSQPIICINMEKFQTVPNLTTMKLLESDTVDRQFFTLKGAVHLNPSDMPFIGNKLIRWLVGEGTKIKRFTALDLTSRLIMQFLGRQFNICTESDFEEFLEKKNKRLLEGIPLQVRK